MNQQCPGEWGDLSVAEKPHPMKQLSRMGSIDITGKVTVFTKAAHITKYHNFAAIPTSSHAPQITNSYSESARNTLS